MPCRTMCRYTFWADDDLPARLKIAAGAAHTTPSKLLRQFIRWGFDRLVAEGVIQRATPSWQRPERSAAPKPTENQKPNENTQS
jgi:hypothetical protein